MTALAVMPLTLYGISYSSIHAKFEENVFEEVLSYFQVAGFAVSMTAGIVHRMWNHLQIFGPENPSVQQLSARTAHLLMRDLSPGMERDKAPKAYDIVSSNALTQAAKFKIWELS